MTPIEVLEMLKVSIDKAALKNANHALETSEVEAIRQALHIHSIGGPGSDVRSEGEQLGNEAVAKSVCVDCDCANEYAKYYIGWICSKCNKALRV